MLPRNRAGFEEVGNPFPTGRVVQGEIGRPLAVNAVSPKQSAVDTETVLKAVEKAIKQSLTHPADVQLGVGKAPFDRAKSIAYYRFLKLYLQSQLVQVDHELNKLLSEEDEHEEK